MRPFLSKARCFAERTSADWTGLQNTDFYIALPSLYSDMAVTGWTYSGPEVVQTPDGDIHEAKLLYLTTPMTQFPQILTQMGQGLNMIGALIKS